MAYGLWPEAIQGQCPPDPGPGCGSSRCSFSTPPCALLWTLLSHVIGCRSAIGDVVGGGGHCCRRCQHSDSATGGGGGAVVFCLGCGCGGDCGGRGRGCCCCSDDL